MVMVPPNQTHNRMLPRKDAASLLQRELDFSSSQGFLLDFMVQVSLRWIRVPCNRQSHNTYDFCLGLGSSLSRLYLLAPFLPHCKTLQTIKTISRQPSLSPRQDRQPLKEGQVCGRASLPCWNLASSPRDTGFPALPPSWTFLLPPCPRQEGR